MTRKTDIFGDVLSIIIAIFVIIKNYIRSVILAFQIPGPPALPILGNTLMLKNDKIMCDYGKNAYKLFGPFARVWIGILPGIFIYEPKHLKILLANNRNNEKSLFYRALHNFLGEGLLTNNGFKWKNNRRMIQPYFHLNVLDKFVEHFVNASHRFMDKLKEEQTVKITPFINDCILDILHNGVLGVPLDMDSPYRKGEMHAIERFMKPWLLLESIFNRTSSASNEKKQKQNLHTYTRQILANRKKGVKDSSKECFLDYFIEIGEKNPQFTDDDLINETVTFMLAGQDSVGATLAFTTYFIARHQDVQEKIMNELSSFDVNEKLNLQKLNEMKYLEQVIKESLRLIPPVPILSRVLTEDITMEDKVFPSGTILFMSPFITQRLPHVFPDPEKFDPDRFKDSNIEKMHPYAFLPFSLGPRKCIGNIFAYSEIKTVLFYLLKKYHLSLPKGKEELRPSWRVTVRAKGGIWVNFKPRNP